jgi:hypothetical protein
MLLQGGEAVNEGTGLSASAEGPSQNSQLPRGLEGRAVNALNKFGQTAKYNSGTYRPAPIMPGKISLDPLLWKNNHVKVYVLLIFLGIETYSPVLTNN